MALTREQIREIDDAVGPFIPWKKIVCFVVCKIGLDAVAELCDCDDQ